jgi:hypothetical protein
VLRILVQEELHPITVQKPRRSMARSFHEIFKCRHSYSVHHVATTHSLVPGYRWLYEVPKILHRDISLNNLMLRKAGNVYTGVLNDLDLAVMWTLRARRRNIVRALNHSWQLTSFDLSSDVHRYRHDLESSSLIWMTSRFHNGKEIVDPPLQGWVDCCRKTTHQYHSRPWPTDRLL